MKKSGLVTLVLAGGLFAVTAFAAPKEIKGAAILKHPIGVLALKQVKLVHAGKIDAVYALRTASEKADWKTATAQDKKDLAEMMPLRAPAYAPFEAALAKSGVLTIDDNGGQLQADLGADGTVIAYYKLEGGQWRGFAGPVVVAGEPEPGSEQRISGAEILDHPIAAVAMEYVTHVHAGKMDKAMALASAKAQAEWKSSPASEKKESAAFLKKMMPPAKTMRSAIESGGILIIEGDELATLNIIVTEQTSPEPGVYKSSSTTSAIAFVFEAGKWKVSR